MKYKVSELTDEMLDAAVRLALGVAFEPEDDAFMPSDHSCDSGPLIEKYKLYIEPIYLGNFRKFSHWESGIRSADGIGSGGVHGRGFGVYAKGRTANEAAMRALVCNMTGEEVDL